MRAVLILIAVTLAAPCSAASITAATLLDDDGGRAFDLGARVPITDTWDISAGIGRGESEEEGEQFAGNRLRAATDVSFGALLAGASVEHWKDSGQLQSTVLRGELGWMSENGIALSALLVDRALRLDYAATGAGQLRERRVDFDGTGFGADLGYFGDHWHGAARFIAYDYGRNVERVRAVLEASGTQRLPRLQLLLRSVATRAAGAPDQELSLMLGRQWRSHSLTADWQRQRDALTGDDSWSAGITWGIEPGSRWTIDTSVGISAADAATSATWIGVALSYATTRRND